MASEVQAADLEVEALGEGPPVLFVHGSVVGPEHTWRKQRVLADRWSLRFVSRPGFGASPELERLDFEVEAPMVAELLGDGAHLVGHSYGSVIALLAAGLRPEAVWSLTVSEPGSLRLAVGVPEVDRMISDGTRLFGNPERIPTDQFLNLFRWGAGSAHETPEELPDYLRRGVELLKSERPSWEAEVPVAELAAAPFPKLVISGGHSPAFEAVCDAHAEAIGAERASIPGRGHTIPSTGEPYNDLLDRFMSAAEARAGSLADPPNRPATS